MQKLLVLFLAVYLSQVIIAQECKPLYVDGSTDAVVPDERQNFLAQLPPRLSKSQEAQVLTTMKELGFAKYAEDGCYVRAQVLANQLAKAQISDTYKTWLFAPSHYTFFLNGFVKPKILSSSWNYHVALSYVNTTGNQMIVDPAIDSKNAMTYDDWLSKLDCTQGSLMMRTHSSRWLPATVTTDDNVQRPGYYAHGRNPFNGFMFSQDQDTPEILSKHLARDDVGDKFAACPSVSKEKASILLKRLTEGAVFEGPECKDVTSYFKERFEHWKALNQAK